MMQQALPYKSSCLPMIPGGGVHHVITSNSLDELKKVVKDNAVIVVGRRGCCMSHVVKRLLQCLGANPAMYEIKEEDENEVVNELENIIEDVAGDGRREAGKLQFPAVFVGGELYGGLDRIMAAHITGELTPVLKKAGALWL